MIFAVVFFKKDNKKRRNKKKSSLRSFLRFVWCAFSGLVGKRGRERERRKVFNNFSFGCCLMGNLGNSL